MKSIHIHSNRETCLTKKLCRDHLQRYFHFFAFGWSKDWIEVQAMTDSHRENLKTRKGTAT